MRNRTIYIVLMLLAACKESYEPPALKAISHFLVVDGFINASQNGKTTITLSRTTNLADTIGTIPEINAQVSIEAQSGSRYILTADNPGIYSTPNPVTITIGGLYRLRIVTRDRKEYASDFVPVKKSPLIDSLNWEQQNNVTVFLNSHDPQNQSIYYRWDYVETWEYHATLRNYIGVNNGLIFYRDSTSMADKCWSTAKSTDIIIGSSIKLSQDKIDHFPIAFVTQHSEKIGIRYSALINQYTLTEEAFKYWQILQKNTQQLGTLFDPQPSQLKGNIHCITNPGEPVIGFVSASTVESKRIFISRTEIVDWTVVNRELECKIELIPQNPSNYLMYNYPDTSYAPYYFVTGGIVLTKRHCIDCTTRGGLSRKPSFW